jgi:peptidoglycan/LPS O-acetylase OafA/YrhL
VPGEPRHADRNDALDGLRFVAVAAVLAFHHRIPGAEAGFLGVDLFFVLSGFLITTILLRQVERGRISLSNFWTRRVRRLAPALIVALTAMIVWGSLEASMTVRDSLRGDITATLAYVANWHFIASSSYFEATGEESPLQHMWSLAVEEQFYVLWPLILCLVLLFVRPTRLRLPAIVAVAATGALISAWRLWSLWGGDAPDRAFMGTDSRMFEPLVGALLAVVLLRAPRVGAARGLNSALILAGSAAFVWAMFTLGGSEEASGRYARGGALIFAIASASLIWALATRRSVLSAFLATAPIAYLGRISYGIYIWHWPLIVWAGSGEWLDMSGSSAAVRVSALTAATVALASLSYHLVEKPIRYGGPSVHLNPRRIAVGLPMLLCGLIALNTAVVVPHAGARLAAGTPVTKTIILVGDSVPQALAAEFADAAKKRGFVVIRATRGGCPATGVMKVYSSGETIGRNLCPLVPGEQDRKVKAYRPAIVIWWSRYEVAPRLGPGGKVLPLGSKAYWNAQQASFEERARALTKLGARLLAVQIERPGHALAARNPPESSFLVGRTLLYRRDVVDAWNAFLGRHHGPRVFSLSVDRLVCHDADNPCDDRLPNGDTARPDGVHYSDQAGRRVVAHVLGSAWRMLASNSQPGETWQAPAALRRQPHS